jgi:hypothetical protein
MLFSMACVICELIIKKTILLAKNQLKQHSRVTEIKY